MKITKEYLREVIKEELSRLEENPILVDDTRLTAGFNPDELAVYNAFKTLNDLNSLDGKAKEKLSAYPRVKTALINRANLTIRK